MYNELLDALQDQNELLSCLEREHEHAEGKRERAGVKERIEALEARIEKTRKALHTWPSKENTFGG